MRETNKFHFLLYFETLFYTKLPSPLTWWSKDLLFESVQVAPAVNFEIHLCSSGSSVISDCIWRSASNRYVQVRPGMNSDLGNGSFWVKIRVAENVDRCSWKCTRVCSHQLTSDLKRCSLFWKCLQLSCLISVSVPPFVLGRLRGSPATSALVYF